MQQMPKSSEVSEAQFQRSVTDALSLFGWLWYHTHDSRRSNKGFPDLVAVRGQRVLYVELKREDGRVTVEQSTWLQRLKDAGQSAYVLRPSQMDAFLEVIR